MKSERIVTIKTKEPFRLGWPVLSEPADRNGDNRFFYRANLMYPLQKELSDSLPVDIVAAAKEALRRGKGGESPSRDFRWPWFNGNDKEKEVYHGYVHIRAKTKYPPLVFTNEAFNLGDRRVPTRLVLPDQAASVRTAAKRVVDTFENESGLYPGCWCKAKISFSYYKVDGGEGITTYFSQIIKVGEDDPFVGGDGAFEDEELVAPPDLPDKEDAQQIDDVPF